LTQQTKGQHVKRHAAKWLLARMLCERDWGKQQIVDLFGIIDWIMRIPPELQSQLMSDIADLEKERNMPYLNSFERAGLERGRQEGRQEGRLEGQQDLLRHLLVARFGSIPPAVEQRLARAKLSELTAWGEAVLDAPTLEGVFRRP
jgi:predicted transposase YdaD